MGRAWIIPLLLGLVLASQALARDPSQHPAGGGADTPALLVADQIFLTADQVLIAQGNVEAIQGDIRLRASRITLDRASGKLTILGPIRIDQGGTTTVLADFAELDKGLQNGILTGARLILNEQLQLAGLQMTRVGGRYTQLYKTTVTSCRACEKGRPPLWQIRARKVIHDQLERQLYFEGAQFRVMDVPVFYLPAIRLPDPTLKRSTGFLVPSLRTTSQLGTGVRIPYFIRLGDHRDLTVAPFYSAKSQTLNLRFRQALRAGRFQFQGAFTRDDLIPGQDRGYVFGTGLFNLPRDFKLEFDIKTVSDNAYLVDYGLPDIDRLQSQVTLTRVKRDNLIRLGLIHYKSLRDSENGALIPSLVGDATLQKRLFPASFGGEIGARIAGELRLGLNLHSHTRTSPADVLGRDVDSATLDIDWRRARVFASGIRADWQIGYSTDVFNIQDDSNFQRQTGRQTPRAGLALRLPMTRTMASGVTQFLEPVMQIGWSRASGGAVPNDQSGFVEFDQGNLLSLSRFPAYDRRENGATLVYGLNWARFSPTGWQAAATIGQVIRQQDNPDFSATSGLSGMSSNMLVAGQIKLKKGLSLTARGILDNSLGFSKAELRGDWDYKRIDLSSSYLWLGSDLGEGRPDPVSEIWFDGTYDVSPQWKASANLRYDVSDARATTAGIGFVYRSECVRVDFSLNRRYTSSTSVEPSTNFGFTISLSGFAVESRSKEYKRTCESQS